MNEVEYSVVVPVFNSEASLEELVQPAFTAVMEGTGKPYEMIFVDDGSSDGSWEVLKKIKEEHPEVSPPSGWPRISGSTAPLSAVLISPKAIIIITIDDDLQCPPEEIPKLIKNHGRNVIPSWFMASTKKRNIRFTGILAANHLKNRFKSPWTSSKDGSSFRLISKNIIQKIIVHHQNFVFIDEILHWYTDYISFTHVEHHKRKYKRSGYSHRKIWSMFANIVLLLHDCAS